MTSSRQLAGLFAAAVLAALGVVPVHARQSNSQPATRAVLIQPTASQQQFRQAVRQSQVSDQLQKSQLENQLRQESIERTRRKPGSATPNDKQVDAAAKAQDQLYNAQQRDRVQRYKDALVPQPVPRATKDSASVQGSASSG